MALGEHAILVVFAAGSLQAAIMWVAVSPKGRLRPVAGGRFETAVEPISFITGAPICERCIKPLGQRSPPSASLKLRVRVLVV